MTVLLLSDQCCCIRHAYMTVLLLSDQLLWEQSDFDRCGSVSECPVLRET